MKPQQPHLAVDDVRAVGSLDVGRGELSSENDSAVFAPSRAAYDHGLLLAQTKTSPSDHARLPWKHQQEAFVVDLTDTLYVDSFISGAANLSGETAGAAATTSSSTARDYYVTTGAYNVYVDFIGGGWTGNAYLQEAFIACADRISLWIQGDVLPVGDVDDIVITAELKYIDGAGRILGQAGPTGLRGASYGEDAYLPYSAMMEFETADAASYYKAGHWDEIVMHEMLHSIGFGTVWDYKKLVAGKNYVGAQAVGEYSTMLSKSVSGIPLETKGGRGTAFSHWSESVFDEELMTGYVERSGAMPLTSMSIASLGDLGYDVSRATAQSYGEILA